MGIKVLLWFLLMCQFFYTLLLKFYFYIPVLYVFFRFRYQRGRLNYEQINASIDEFNSALTTKYKLLATAKSKQSDRVRKAIWDYKEQETKDTKGGTYNILSLKFRVHHCYGSK